MQEILPWQQKNWEYLLTRKKLGKLPHAILIGGVDGVGKNIFAKNFASFLLCQNGIDKACEECDSCRLYQAGNHPDLITLRCEEKSKIIKVDQIRNLITGLSNTSHFGGFRVVIIETADLMNIAASNSLLKTLEEPYENTIIILVSSHPTMLPATIRSRCQDLSINTPNFFVAKEWLETKLPDENVDLLLALSENSPFKALDLISEDKLSSRQAFIDDLFAFCNDKMSVIEMVKSNLDFGLDNILLILMHMTSDLIKIKLSLSKDIINIDQVDNLNNLSTKTTLNRLFAYKEELYNLRRNLDRKINLNQQMAMENLMISWSELRGQV